MRDDLISRQAVIEELHQYFSVGFDSDRYWNSTHVMQAIANVPIVEAKTGHWIANDDYDGEVYYTCSRCEEPWVSIDGTPQENGMKYCPHCGAKMKIISTNTKKETGDTYSRGSNIPKPNKRPPMPPVKHPKENERQEQKDACVNCRYYLVDPLSDPCDECTGKAGFGYNRRSAAIEPRKEDENG